jgi:hypothetical protein
MELVLQIVEEAWLSLNSTKERISFMLSCPLINDLWRASYAQVAARDIYIPTSSFLAYLASVANKSSHSFVYSGTCVSLAARTMTCCVNFDADHFDIARHPYVELACLSNYAGIRVTFPNLKRIILQLVFTMGHSTTMEWGYVPTKTNIEINLSPERRNHVSWDVFIHEACSEPRINDWGFGERGMSKDIYRYTMSMMPENHTLSRAMYLEMKDLRYPYEVPVSNVSISFDKSMGIVCIHGQFKMVEEPGKGESWINFIFGEAIKPNDCMLFVYFRITLLNC